MNRRELLQTAGSAAGLALLSPSIAQATTPAPGSAADQNNRRLDAYDVRVRVALDEKTEPTPTLVNNGDEDAYPTRVANFSKGLPHNAIGHVDPAAYNALLKACASGKQHDFEAIPLGGQLKLASPQAAFAWSISGPDSHRFVINRPPRLGSERMAGNAIELYWQAMARDVLFSRYGDSQVIQDAASDLSGFSDFPNATPANVFRASFPGQSVGPFISQFLWLPIPAGAHNFDQHFRMYTTGLDHLTQFAPWLAMQNGGSAPARTYDADTRYIIKGRDLATFVHIDYLCQAPINALLIMADYGANAISPTNPYRNLTKQASFATWGTPFFIELTARVKMLALQAAWAQKWYVHRWLRPEEFGGLVDNRLNKRATYPFHSTLLNSPALDITFAKQNSYLLSQVYPEGCPAHPSLTSGHATVAGATCTMLKAFFNEDFVIPNPKVPTDDGLSLVDYTGPALTIGGELSKLAANIGAGRNFAGIHWRWDMMEGMKLGEQVAMALLKEVKETSRETFAGFSFTKFDGTRANI